MTRLQNKGNLNAKVNEKQAGHRGHEKVRDSMKAKLYFGLTSLSNRLLMKSKISLNGAFRISIILLNRDTGCLSLCLRFNTPSLSFSLFRLLGGTFFTFVASSIWLPSCSTNASPLLLFRWPTPNAAQILRMCLNLVAGQLFNKYAAISSADTGKDWAEGLLDEEMMGRADGESLAGAVGLLLARVGGRRVVSLFASLLKTPLTWFLLPNSMFCTDGN